MIKKLILCSGIFRKTKTDLTQKLIQNNFEVIYTESTDQLLQCAERQTAAVILLESSNELDWDAIEVTNQIRTNCRKIPIILLVENSSENLAINAIKVDIDDYFKIPIDYDELVTSINKIYSLKVSAENKQQQHIPFKKCIRQPKIKFVGSNENINHIRQLVEKYAQTSSNVLITGETGTGKELIARMIHSASSRCKSPIICVNCAAIPENLFESELFGYERGAFTGAQSDRDGMLIQANKGTLFLDEIGELSACAQAKILRAIETKVVQKVGCKHATSVDIHIIAATNQCLEDLVDIKQFRKDLFFRLNIARIHLPPLRERSRDINELCNHFMSEFNGQYKQNIQSMDQEVLSLFLKYDWPGNVRELKNVMEAIFINQPTEKIHAKDLPDQYYEMLTKNFNKQTAEPTQEEERDKLLVALMSTNWNKSKAAEKLSWSRMTLYRKMQKYQITDDENVDSHIGLIGDAVTM